jgi:putative addiction module component (TIGR02574 family)
MLDSYPMLKSLGLDQMSIPDRLHLLEELWDSIAETPEAVPLTEAQRAEVDRRLAARAANPDAGSSWEEVKARLQKRS